MSKSVKAHKVAGGLQQIVGVYDALSAKIADGFSAHTETRSLTLRY